MLKKFTGRKNILLVPAVFLNTVANMLTNIRSPSGSVKVSSEGEDEGANLRIDIEPKGAAALLAPVLASKFVRKGDMSLLGEGLKWGERGLTIDKDWFRREVLQGEKA